MTGFYTKRSTWLKWVNLMGGKFRDSNSLCTTLSTEREFISNVTFFSWCSASSSIKLSIGFFLITFQTLFPIDWSLCSGNFQVLKIFCHYYLFYHLKCYLNLCSDHRSFRIYSWRITLVIVKLGVTCEILHTILSGFTFWGF